MTVSRLSINGSAGIAIPNNYNLNIMRSKVVKIATAISGPAVQTITSLTPVVINGLSVTYTPLGTNTTIFIFANISHAVSYVMSFGIYRNGVATVSTTGQTNSNIINMQATYFTENQSGFITNSHIMHYENSASLTPRTYDIRTAAAFAGVANIMYVNNRSTSDMACFSHMMIMEVE